MTMSALHPLLADATRLTRCGDLQAATAAIQAALRGSAPAPAADVIDVAARVVDDGRDTPCAEPPHETTHETTRGTDAEFGAGRFVHEAGTRDYKLYVPPGATGRALPMVLMLHGCTQNPDDFAAGTRMNEAARRHGFVVLYPAQAQSANPSRCWNWFRHEHQQRGRGEPALLAEMTRAVAQRHGVDARRVYAAGLSAGGAMVALLAETYPELFAAVGVHSGLPPGAAADARMAFDAMKRGAPPGPGRAGPRPPMIVFHGDRDTTVHPGNGEQLIAPYARAAASGPQRVSGRDGREFTQHVYRGPDGRVIAEHWVVHGAGHAWSGGSPAGSYTDGKGPDATGEMVRFFREHALLRASAW